MPGVLAVITHLNAPKLNPFPENTQKSKPEAGGGHGHGGGGMGDMGGMGGY